MLDSRKKDGLTNTQKTGFVLLLVFGLLAVSLGVLQMRNTIYNPFAIHLSDNSGLSELLDNQEARLQSIDTDHDGLNDWEELNFYFTSPYLPDSDSDGMSDKEEITSGSDPLCPKGQVCESAQSIPNLPVEPMTSPVASGFVTPVDVLSQAGLTGVENDDISNVLYTLSDPAKVRQLLIDSGGISESELSKIDDETLMKMVGELLSEQTGGQVGGEQILDSASALESGVDYLKETTPSGSTQ